MNSTADQIRSMQENIRSMDNSALHHAMSSWHSKERRCQLLVLIHLAEIEQRKLYLDLGYMHLGDYCQSYLGLSDNEAWLRVYVARAGLRYPSLLVALVEGSISLTVAGMLARHIRDDNVEELLAARGVASAPQRCSLRPLLVSLAKVEASSPTQPKGAEHPRELALEASSIEKEPNTKLVHKLSCTISDETKDKLLRLAELLGIVDPIANLDLVITKAADLALRAKDPATRSATHATPVKNKSPEANPSSIAPPRSRYIAAAVRRELLARAGYRCEFNGPEGKRSRQRTDLEVDHIHAFSWGGSNVISNLQVLCSSHNRRKYERERERSSPRLSG